MKMSAASVLALALSASFQESRRAPATPGSAASSSASGAPVEGIGDKPDGSGLFFQDPHKKGGASAVRLVELVWGRLVDVHGLAQGGTVAPLPVFADLVIDENVQSDGVDYRLATNPVTQKTRLVILRPRGTEEFHELLRNATANLPSIVPKSATTSAPPFSLLPRNAALMARFDDLLDDDATAAADLIATVKIFTGYPPQIPFSARLFFDPNHGGVVGGGFHSTRVLIDMTVSELEAQGMPVPQPINLLGLPESGSGNSQANVELRIPTQVDFSSGQFVLLTNLSGAPLSFTENGPVDPNSPTLDVVRALRSGNADDPNNGFLLDLDRPELLGGWSLTVDALTPIGERKGFLFLADLTFSTVCQAPLRSGAVLAVGSVFLEVLEPGVGPAPGSGQVTRARVMALSPRPLVNPGSALGAGLLLTPFDPLAGVDEACWVSFTPTPLAFPSGGVSTFAQVLARFSEPLSPETVRPFDTFRVVRGDALVQASATNLVIGQVLGSVDVSAFTFSPTLPFAHVQGQAEVYHVEIDPPAAGACGITDLAGNPLRQAPPAVEFTLDSAGPSESNGGVVLRFASPDELDPIGAPDLRGQFFYDLTCGSLDPRPVTYYSAPVDRTNPVPSIMIPFPLGVQTPLNPLGAKLQNVWRYADLGWNVRDETQHNVDVAGLNWSPVGGQAISDFYEDFEIRLSHAVKQPDEEIDNQNLLPVYPDSGLFGPPHPFTENILNDPLSPQKIVHPRALGYVVNPADLFHSATGTPLMPYPLNQGPGPLTTYTWRDTAALSDGAPDGAGIPLDIEAGPPLFLEPVAGAVAPSGQVPSFGLPLLMEFRCYPSNSGLGLNSLDVSLAVNSSAQPYFRVFSAGGINTAGLPVVKNPDLELVPSGGFNPFSLPPGQPTPGADSTFYIGQLDLVIRVSRGHTVWIDTLATAPTYLKPAVEPEPALQPQATQVVIDYRGADGFSGAGSAPFDASQLDPYGDVETGSVLFHNGIGTWSDDITDVNGARYLQMRFTFLNAVATGLTAELSSVGVAFLE